jgi:hypothetical protein
MRLDVLDELITGVDVDARVAISQGFGCVRCAQGALSRVVNSGWVG